MRDRADDVDARQPFIQHRRGEEIIGHEAAQRAADPLFVVGNDAGMRDRQAERAPEQSDHREPVGAGADHSGFGEGAQIGQPRPIDFGHGGGDEEERHQEKQQRRDGPHPPQPAAQHGGALFGDLRNGGAALGVRRLPFRHRASSCGGWQGRCPSWRAAAHVRGAARVRHKAGARRSRHIGVPTV